jgi:NAD(P)-dependent dehydrogenase (short-subunit alcohol dehydrogenase family)
MSQSLDGYAVLITGGSSGLGLSHARVLGGRGAKIAITDF